MRTPIAAILLLLWTRPTSAQEKAESPRVESVVPAAKQPHAGNPAVIWYDSFDGPESTQLQYFEYQSGTPGAKRSDQEALGGTGQSLELFYGKGKQGVGGRKLLFGDAPFGRPVRKGERFTDVYWRIYVKHQKGWTGSPAKMSRATGFASGSWTQAFILHVWSGSGSTLTLDPARGVRDAQVVTTKYNDFPNLKWLGNSPSGKFPVHATEEAGRWICVEARLKLNSPGKADGLAQLWVDGVLDTERKGMDFRGTYDEHTINAVFLESYWNEGSPVDQYRWYDDFVVSTQPIGPLVAPRKPTLLLTSTTACEVEIAGDSRGSTVVWSTPSATGKVVVTTALEPGTTYFCRVRHPGGEWSPWHQPFVVEK
ncbi:MAG TPA: fibronectin type III domain-containing protein [Planctomycetota bacterium]|nr:fibronectin type III domain-containing protein [Planctomycetota bacterium]